jgi:hypothetical protein
MTSSRLAPANGTHAPGLAAEAAMKHPSDNQPQEVLAGLVERVTYTRRNRNAPN